jgi:L,D-transpeptidase ErfK/SrfK
MNVSIRPMLGRVVLLAAALVAGGCQVTRQAEPTPPPPPEPPPIQAPVATHKFRFDPEHDEVVGEIQITHVQGEDTLPDIARRFNVGYEEILRANPGVDPWLPGVGRAIVVPTQYVLPDGPREGIVVNLAQLRVFYFPKQPKLKKGEVDDGLRTVITHPIGIGKIGWQTPEGTTKVTSKQKNPTWTPPLSVRKEHKENGDPLPARVPPGPDNPLGAYKMTLGWPSYLIHGTNKPYGVGMRSSHGCVRFYPEDIADLYDQVPVGTKFTVVNQPFVFGWHRGEMYVQAFPILEDDEREHPKAADTLLNASISDEMWQKLKQHDVAIDLELVNQMVAQPRGIAMPVSRRDATVESYLATARHVENRVPQGATWNGSDEGMFLAEEFEAVRNGLPLPKKKTPPKSKKTAAKPAGAASGS